jgi:hypothetical protein
VNGTFGLSRPAGSISSWCAGWSLGTPNVGKRLVKSPRIYVRDSGITPTLPGLASQEDVLGHPVAGASWVGFVIETLIATAPVGTQSNFTAPLPAPKSISFSPSRAASLGARNQAKPDPQG